MQLPVRVSVSQIGQYTRCEYRWWWAYGPLQRKSKGGPATWLGSAVHIALEEYESGRGIPEAEHLAELMQEDQNFKDWDYERRYKVAKKAIPISSVGLDKLPEPGTVQVERSIELQCGKAVMLCRIDMSAEGYIGDHKTTSNLSWAKSTHEVANNVQLLTYAYAALHEDPPEVVKVELLYRTTRGVCHTLNVSAEVPWQRVEDNWREMMEISDSLVEHKYDETPDKLKPNINACGDFRGCEHQGYCQYSPKNRNKTLRSDTMRHSEKAQSIRDRLGLSRILPPNAPPNIEQTDTLLEDAARAVAIAEPEQVQEVYNARGVAPENRVAPVETSAVAPAVKPLRASDLEQLSERLDYGDDAEVAYLDMVRLVEDQYGKKLTARRWQAMLDNAGLVEYEGELVDAAQWHKAEAAAEPDLKVAEPEPLEVPTPVKDLQSTLAAVRDQAHQREQQLSQVASFDMVVLVDCYFEKTPPGAITLSEYVASYQATVSQQSGVDYYELIEYNEGAKQIAGKLMAAVYKDHPKGVLLVDSGDPLASRVLSILRSCDGVAIIRGK
tara:strand:+ start:1943 stop:3604 length:1662 start_codon:yes stop_codon:yes gene_type:complete